MSDEDISSQWYGSDMSDEEITAELKKIVVSLQRISDECLLQSANLQKALAGSAASRKIAVRGAAVIFIDDHPVDLLTDKGEPIKV